MWEAIRMHIVGLFAFYIKMWKLFTSKSIKKPKVMGKRSLISCISTRGKRFGIDDVFANQAWQSFYIKKFYDFSMWQNFPIKLILHLELKYDNGSTKEWSNSMTRGNCTAGKISVMGVTDHVNNLQSFSRLISPFNLKLFHIIFPKVDVCMYATIWYRCSEVSQKVSSDQRVICEFEELSADQKTIRGSKNCGIYR